MNDQRLAHLEHRVHELEAKVVHLSRTLERIEAMGMNLSDLIVALNDNTNAVGARLDKLAQDLTAAKGGTVTDAQLGELQAIADHLKALGADPQNPIPSPPPITAATPVPSSPPADSTPAADTSSTPAAQGTTDPAATPAAPAGDSTAS